MPSSYSGPAAAQGGPTSEDILYQLTHAHDDRSHIALGVNVALFVMAAVAVVLRFVSRFINGAQMKRDDYAMLVALVLSLGLFIGGDIAILYGFGKHSIPLGVPKLVKFLKESFAWNIIYVLCSFTVKLSIVFLYQRIFYAFRGFWRWSWVYVGFAACYCLAGILLEIFNCTPIRKSWDVTLEEGHCIKPLPALISMAAINIVFDVVLFAMPIPLIWRVQISTKQKLAILFVFSLGLLACVASAFRAYYISVAIFGSDPTWHAVPLGIWSLVEIDVGILCACLPILRPLLRRFKPIHLIQILKSHLPSRPSFTISNRKSSSSKKDPNLSTARLASTISWPGRRMEALLDPPSSLSRHTSSYYSWTSSGPTQTSFLSMTPSPPGTPVPTRSPLKPYFSYHHHPPSSSPTVEKKVLVEPKRLSISHPQSHFSTPRPVPRPLRRVSSAENRLTLWRRFHPLEGEKEGAYAPPSSSPPVSPRTIMVDRPLEGRRHAVELLPPMPSSPVRSMGRGLRREGGSTMVVPPPVPAKDWMVATGLASGGVNRAGAESCDVEWAAGGGNRF